MPSRGSRKGVASFDAADWDRCAGRGNPFLSHAFLSALEESGSATAQTGWQPVPIAIDGPDGAPGRGDAGLCQEPQPGRICVRPCLGRRLRARGRRIIIPSCRSRCRSRRCPGGGCSPAIRMLAPRADRRRRGGGARQHGLSSAHATFIADERSALVRGGGLADPHRQPVPLAQRRLSPASTISSPRSSSRKRKAIRKERARGAGGARDRPLDRRRDRGGALGRLLALLPGYRRAQMGPALSDPRLLLLARRADGRPDAADLRAIATACRSPARST